MQDLEREYATTDDLPSVAYKELHLEGLNKWVRVRFLSTPELAALSMLPELARFTELMQEQQKVIQKNEKKDQDKPEAKMKDDDQRELVAERMRYMVRCAHMALVADPSDTEESACDDCGLKHIRSLWQIQQVSYMKWEDLAAIVEVAERVEDVDPTSPSSEDETEPATDESARTGASTQEVTSSA